MPAANLFRATFFFSDAKGQGWTETYYSQKTTLALTLQAARDILPLRRQLLGNTAFVRLLRVSDDLVKRDSLIFKVGDSSQTTTLPAAGQSDAAFVCLVVRMQSGANVRRSLSLRGVPDDISVNAGQFALVPGFAGAFLAWRDKIIADGWAIKTRDPFGAFATILSFVQAANGDVTIETAAASGILQNDPVTIVGVRGATALNGSWNVFSVVDATHFKIKLNTVLKPWTGGGTVRARLYVINPIDDVIAMRISHRIAGRPFDLQRGRRRARARS